MQEKTLEKEFEEFIENETMIDWRIAKDLLPFIYSREEKAREEGRKEGFQKGKEWEREMWKNGKVALYEKEVITQYKSELLYKVSKLEISNCDNDSTIFNHKDYVCLSEVKKLLN